MNLTTKPSCPPATSDLWQQANDHHAAAERAALTAIERARQCGEVLIKLKAECRHGEWGKRLKANFSGSARTARAYMQLARNWEEIKSKMAESAILSVDGALKMLAESTVMQGSIEVINQEYDLPEIPDGMFLIGVNHSEHRHVEICPSRTYPGFTWLAMYDARGRFVDFLKKPFREDYIKAGLSHWGFNLGGVDRWIEAPTEKFNQWYLEDEPWAFREQPAELATGESALSGLSRQ